MKKKLFLTLCLCLVVGFSLTAQTTYYVQSTGDDATADGSDSATPFLTVAAAYAAASGAATDLASADVIQIVGKVDHNADIVNLNKFLKFEGANDGVNDGELDAKGTSFGMFGFYWDKELSFTNLTFSNVTAKAGPGAVLNANNADIGDVTFTNCNFNSNTVLKPGSVKNGGAIFYGGTNVVAGRTLTVTNCTFTSNSTDDGGGALYVGGNSKLILSNSTFKTNSASGAGGGGAIEIGSTTTANISGCLFDGNFTTHANGHGGALNYNVPITDPVTLTAQLTLSNSTFVNNTSSNRGGAVILNGVNGNANLTNVTIYNNTTAKNNADCGGLRTQGGNTKIINLTNCLIYGNNSTTDGGTASNIDGNTGSILKAYNCLTVAAANEFDNADLAADNTNRAADLTNSNLDFVTPNVTFTAPTALTDDTPIDFGTDTSDIGAWDSKINIFTNASGDNSWWENDANWSNGVAPTTIDDNINVAILTGSNNAILRSANKVTVNNLLMNGTGTLQFKNGASLIVKGTAPTTGDVTDIRYDRVLIEDVDVAKGWHLVASPFSGETMDNFISRNDSDLLTSTTPGNVGNRSIATYNNTTESYDYLASTPGGDVGNGKGYSVKIKDGGAGNVYFRGAIGVADVDFTLTKNTNGYNLIGNPFTSSINSKDFLEDNVLNITNQQIWIWDSSANSKVGDYLVKPAGDAFNVAPTQGFFVECAVAGTVTVATSSQTHESFTFEKTSAKTEVKLSIKDGVNDKFALINFTDNSTKGFDNGYDGEMFGGVVQEFQVYTQLVEGNIGKNYQIQSLSNSDVEATVVPVGVKSATDKDLTFSAESLNLPSGLKVYLEDRVANTFTNLSEENATYKVTLKEALNGIGRFYIHTASKALSIATIDASDISVYQSNASTLRVVGLEQGNATISVYNVLGKQVLRSSFTSNGVQDIALPKLATGMYIVQLESATGKLNKKVILE
ncbi:T9SS type A sorting domain-containing protein [Polaribacter sp. Z014]|uniref:T9SS type A sorting domain-containing protein n=1 Tax=Polaribacter sp. Z014 TaxID=2927126 RepID=UPI002021D7BA|nr:T9SS type A sorting domain-containing protein [Polaribacter sp. Z014]MCL7764542.1 T9SS type A sorting domain-containing protein [Polaribacter sp. Z014]